MSLGSKRLARITALVASLLLGSCGTGGEGERLCALPGKESGLFIDVVVVVVVVIIIIIIIIIVYYCTKTWFSCEGMRGTHCVWLVDDIHDC